MAEEVLYNRTHPKRSFDSLWRFSMNRSQGIHAAGRIGAFFARHILALVVTITVGCILWTVTYCALLLWAAFGGGGLGSPASYPIGLLFIVVGGTAISLALFLPSTAAAEWIARRHGFPISFQIPISIVILALLCLGIVGIAVAVGLEASPRSFAVGFGVLFVAHVVPLGLYWWVVQSGPLLALLYRRGRSIIWP